MSASKFVIAGLLAAGLGLATAGTAGAQWVTYGGPYHHHHYYHGYYGGYRPAVVVTPAPVPAPVVVATPAPVVTAAPVYGYPAPVYGGVGIYRPGFSLGIGFGGWR